MKSLKKTILLAAMVFTGAVAASAQSAEAVKQMANSKSFVFKANSATVFNADAAIMGDNTADLSNKKIPLKADAVVKVKPDSVSSSLPYFDQTQSQDNAMSNDVVNVTVNETQTKASATHYEYNVEEKKKGEVEVTIKPKDSSSNISKYIFNLNPDGTGKLVVSVGSKRITYDGAIASN